MRKSARIALLAGLLGAPPASAGADGLTLTVTAAGFESTTGSARFALFDSEDAWLTAGREASSQVVAIAGDRVTVSFEGLAPGVYGVSVVHDENSNGKLDFQWLPPGPAEGSGVSNDAPARFGPPSFRDAKLALEADAQITVSVRY